MPIENDQGLRDILASVCTIALVGASEKNSRPSHEVMEYLQQKGYRVIPVNPRLEGKQLLGETVYADLASIPEPVDMAELFLAPERTDAIIDQAIELKIPVLWLQIGVINEAGAERAEHAGLKVVMGRCPKREIPRLNIAS
ncbi:CoA-binding protein [Marinobacter sp. SBS5]|uniref:CoA-binding protein n=1 Tax=Marinobacter sp. SBS5 TaxID=3401754 RepID=UPI003AAE4B59